MNRHAKLSVFFLHGLLFLLLFCAVPGASARYVPQPCKNSFTPEQEIAEGKKAEAQVFRSMPVLPDSSPVSAYVRNLGRKLVAYAPGQKWPFSFHVVDQADVNAFALPGGPIFINLGTIQAAEDEAQLAGVMAHEISHVVLRHATCNLSKQQKQAPFWVIGQIAAGLALPGALGNVASSGIGTVAGLGFLKMSRDAERQADLLGTDILYDAGYDPRGMSQFFEVIQGRYGEGGKQFLSDHPNPGNRTAYVNEEIESLPPKAHMVRTSDAFQAIKKQVSQMQAYSAQEVASGAWKNRSPNRTVAQGSNQPTDNWRPEGNWQTTQQPQYTLSYPGNWRLYDDSGPITIAPQGGLQTMSDGRSAIVYGLLVDLYQPKASPGGSIDLATAMQELIAKLQAENPQMRTRADIRDLTVNGRPGKDVETWNSSESGEGADEHDWIVGVQQPDGELRYLVFVAPGQDFERLRPIFEQMLRSLKINA